VTCRLVQTYQDLHIYRTEHLEQARRYEAALASAALANGQHTPVTPIRIPGLEYHDIRITGRAFELHILKQLSWWSLLKFLFLYLLGYRLPAISILGQEVMAPRGLVRLGLDTLDHSGEEIQQALCLYTGSKSMPNLVHCTQGKDRTGG
jgi:protein-tyrosine phosphatase